MLELPWIFPGSQLHYHEKCQVLRKRLCTLGLEPKGPVGASCLTGSVGDSCLTSVSLSLSPSLPPSLSLSRSLTLSLSLSLSRECSSSLSLSGMLLLPFHCRKNKKCILTLSLFLALFVFFLSSPVGNSSNPGCKFVLLGLRFLKHGAGCIHFALRFCRLNGLGLKTQDPSINAGRDILRLLYIVY